MILSKWCLLLAIFDQIIPSDIRRLIGVCICIIYVQVIGCDDRQYPQNGGLVGDKSESITVPLLFTGDEVLVPMTLMMSVIIWGPCWQNFHQKYGCCWPFPSRTFKSILIGWLLHVFELLMCALLARMTANCQIMVDFVIMANGVILKKWCPPEISSWLQWHWWCSGWSLSLSKYFVLS